MALRSLSHEEADRVTLPDCHSPLTAEQYATLQDAISPLSASQNYGIDIYNAAAALCCTYVEQLISSTLLLQTHVQLHYTYKAW